MQPRLRARLCAVVHEPGAETRTTVTAAKTSTAAAAAVTTAGQTFAVPALAPAPACVSLAAAFYQLAERAGA